MTGQSKRLSLIEAIANVLVGYGVAVLAQIAIFPLFGIKFTQVAHSIGEGFFQLFAHYFS